MTSNAEHLVALGRYREAKAIVVAELASNPDDADLMEVLARCQVSLDEYAEALDSANRVVAQQPDDAFGHLLASIALRGLKRYDDATAAATRAVQLAPNQWQMHAQLALTATHARGQLVLARSAAWRAVQLAPHEAEAHFALGVVAHERKEDDLAREAYLRTLELDPQHAQAVNNLTVLDGRLDLGRSVRGFSESLRLGPHDALVRSNIEGLAASFVRRIYFAGLAVLIIGLLASTAGGGRTIATTMIGVLLLTGIAGYTLHLRRQVPAGVRAFVGRRMRQDAFLLANETLTVVMVVAALLVCLLLDGRGIWLALLRPIGFANVALVVWTVARASAD